jgi:hypothetical protein
MFERANIYNTVNIHQIHDFLHYVSKIFMSALAAFSFEVDARALMQTGAYKHFYQQTFMCPFSIMLSSRVADKLIR